MKKAIVISLLIMVLIIIGKIVMPMFSEHRVDGIDISHHNIVRDWDKVNVGFIYAKATEGRFHRDTKFVRFRKNAMKRNIPFGAYHFLSTDVSAKQQFQNFKNVVPKGSTTLIPMLDVEGELPISNDSLKSLVGGWIKECHDYYGYYPVLYLSPYSICLRLIDLPDFWKCYRWSGITRPHLDIIPFATAKIVQFRITPMDGFIGGVDCNHLNGSLDDLRMRE